MDQSDIPAQNSVHRQVEFDKALRPKVGLGIMILNEYDEVLCS